MKCTVFVILLIIACNQLVFAFDKTKYTTELNTELNSNKKPNKNWVGKKIVAKFGAFGVKSIANKIKTLKILSYHKDNEGFQYFEVKDLSDKYLKQLYFFWFDSPYSRQKYEPYDAPYIEYFKLKEPHVVVIDKAAEEKLKQELKLYKPTVDHKKIYLQTIDSINERLKNLNPDSKEYLDLKETLILYQSK